MNKKTENHILAFAKENWLLILAILYVLSPIDFVPDFVPLLGYTDDLGVLLVSLLVSILQYYRKAKAVKKEQDDNIIEGEVIE